MMFFKSKEEKAEIKRKEQEAAANAKQEAELNAKMTAKTKKKEVQKLIEMKSFARNFVGITI